MSVFVKPVAISSCCSLCVVVVVFVLLFLASIVALDFFSTRVCFDCALVLYFGLSVPPVRRNNT